MIKLLGADVVSTLLILQGNDPAITDRKVCGEELRHSYFNLVEAQCLTRHSWLMDQDECNIPPSLRQNVSFLTLDIPSLQGMLQAQRLSISYCNHSSLALAENQAWLVQFTVTRQLNDGCMEIHLGGGNCF